MFAPNAGFISGIFFIWVNSTTASRLLRLSPQAELFVQGLQNRNLRARHHILKVCALVDIYGEESLRRALEDAVELEAFHSEYILNLLEQRSRPLFNNDNTVTSAILDRLLHHCQTVTITGSSYRMGKKIQD